MVHAHTPRRRCRLRNHARPGSALPEAPAPPCRRASASARSRPRSRRFEGAPIPGPRAHDAPGGGLVGVADGRFVAGLQSPYEGAACAGPGDAPSPDSEWTAARRPAGRPGCARESDAVAEWRPTLRRPTVTWRLALDATSHAARLARLHERIAAGDTYQRQLLHPAAAPCSRRSWLALSRVRGRPAGRAEGAACVTSAASRSCRASPELLLRARAGPPLDAADEAVYGARRDRAEQDDALAGRRSAARRRSAPRNLMIVDMLRNDLGASPTSGSVSTISPSSTCRRSAIRRWRHDDPRSTWPQPGSAVRASSRRFPQCASVTGRAS